MLDMKPAMLNHVHQVMRRIKSQAALHEKHNWINQQQQKPQVPYRLKSKATEIFPNVIVS